MSSQITAVSEVLERIKEVAAANPTPSAKPNRVQAEAFARLLFEGMSGFVNLRAIEEPAPSGRKASAHDHWVEIGPELPAAIGDYVEECARHGYAAYLLPHPVAHGGGGLKDILAQRVVPVDIDHGDIVAKVAAIRAALGEPWITVESGGVEQGQPKVHLYYRLPEAALPEQFEHVAELRDTIARKFGADPKVGRNPAQILRVPGSVHAKGTPRMCALVRTTDSALDVQRARQAAGAICAPSNIVPFSMDFSRDVPAVSMDRVLTQPVLAEGASGDITRFEAAGKAIGHYIRLVREGLLAADDLWPAICNWNATEMRPPWDEARLKDDFKRLLGQDVDKYGPLVAPTPAIPLAATGLKLTDWYAKDKFIGAPPERRWLVEGLIPRGTPGVFAAVGDAGKSMLALQLAIVVACHAAPQTTATSPARVSDTSHFFGQPITGRGTAVFLTGEDDAAEVHRRLDTIDPSGTWRADSSRLIVQPLVSAGGARAYVTSGSRGPEFTPAWHELRAQLEALPDLALVVLDPLTLFVGGDTNDNAVGAAFMGELNQLAARTGAAVVLIHHFAKSANGKIGGLSDARNAVLGAGAWVNNARWSLVLWEADHDTAYTALKALGRTSQHKQAGIVYFGGLTKSNAPAAKELRTLVRGPGGLLEDQTDQLRALAPAAGDVDEALYAELCAMKKKSPSLSFTLSASALWDAWSQAIRKRELPITKDGKGKGKEGIVEVAHRLIDAGRLVQTEDRGKPRYEPVLP